MGLPRFAIRRALIYTHRWLGIAGSVLFLVWFVSGMVMMYHRMPTLDPHERYSRLTDLDLLTLTVSPAEARRRCWLSPRTVTDCDVCVPASLSAG